MTILVPTENPQAHLVLLRETAALFSDKALLQKLLDLPAPIDVCELIAAWNSPFATEDAEENVQGPADSADANLQPSAQ